MSTQSTVKAITLPSLMAMKRKQEKFACLTAYDYCTAHAVSAAGVELILVGDSLGMVMQGHDSSLPVTVEDVAYHVRCVRRGNQGALLMADLPFMSYCTEINALENAAILMREGAQIVKLEGGAWLAESTRLLTERGIPVCAHMGLTPQSINHLGGYRVQGRDPKRANEMVEEAKVLQDAGASIILLECVPAELARRITQALDVPVIGIGAGADCDGQILVLQDLLGLWPGRPAKFVKNYLAGRNDGIQGAIAAYVAEVKASEFPSAAHSYS
ncbi:MAG: 3-methyl-2-oxobutanoate hydroxymethyltransferase [Gammaproteobacteria bacterium]|nr:3-methyl-2-oxobutanoate hydroxymethyltransferase [Gammaproteobacteria bacterium]